MLKSDYIRREHENTLLVSGFICVKEESGIQTWVDMQSGGRDIQHLVFNYPLFVDEFGALSPGDAEEQGAIYFLVSHPPHSPFSSRRNIETTWVSQAIAAARTKLSLPM